MTRFLHICLLLTALLGLIGQSTAMAMAPTRTTAVMTSGSMNGSTQASMEGLNCMDMANAPPPGKAPCKNVTLQCMAAMGCSPLAFTLPVIRALDPQRVEPIKTARPAVTRLNGRSYGPEPDPPSFLI